MIGASLLSLLHTIAQFNGDMSTMLAPLGEYQSVGDYLRDREIAPQLKEATTTWCSFAQVCFKLFIGGGGGVVYLSVIDLERGGFGKILPEYIITEGNISMNP
jgi:hypothetical protein